MSSSGSGSKSERIETEIQEGCCGGPFDRYSLDADDAVVAGILPDPGIVPDRRRRVDGPGQAREIKDETVFGHDRALGGFGRQVFQKDDAAVQSGVMDQAADIDDRFCCCPVIAGQSGAKDFFLGNSFQSGAGLVGSFKEPACDLRMPGSARLFCSGREESLGEKHEGHDFLDIGMYTSRAAQGGA